MVERAPEGGWTRTGVWPDRGVWMNDLADATMQGARWATERDVEQRQAASDTATRIARQLLQALLFINVTGAVLTIALFIYFVGLDRDIASTVAGSLSGPMTSFAIGLLLTVLGGQLLAAAHLVRARMFMEPWEQVDIYVGNNEAAFHAFVARRGASAVWFQRLLAGAGGVLVLSTIAFGIGAAGALSASGVVAAKLPPRPAPPMVTSIPSPASTPLVAPQPSAVPQPYQPPRPVPQTRQP